jgi:charged multivesicular body protein 2A
MGNVFGEQKTAREIIRENKRELNRSIRHQERDRIKLENDEKALIENIKKAAQANQLKTVRCMAKDLVRIRKHQSRMSNTTAQLRAVGFQMSSVQWTRQLAESIPKVTRSMANLNRQLSVPTMNRMMTEFARQSHHMEVKQEKIGDAIDDTMDDGDDEAESDEIVNQVLDEIGVKINADFADAPGKQVVKPEQAEAAAAAAVLPAELAHEELLVARLNNLRVPQQ